MILVTGGTGLVGSHLLYALISNGEKVRATYRNSKSLQKTKKLFKIHSAENAFDKIDWVEADITDYFSLQEIFHDIDKVYHTAATVSFDPKDAAQMMEVNIEGTAHMVNLSLEHNVKKFCFVSSVSALGDYEDNRCVDEEALWQMTADTSNYSVSKYYAENEVWRAGEEGLNVVIVNPATIIGFGNWEESSSVIIKKVYDGLNYYPPGSNGFIGVNDVVKAMLLLMEGESSGVRFLLVADNWKFEKLLQRIAELLGKTIPQKKANRSMANWVLRLEQLRSLFSNGKPLLTKESVNVAFQDKCYSAEKIKSTLGFEFENLNKVLEDTLALYKSQLQ